MANKPDIRDILALKEELGRRARLSAFVRGAPKHWMRQVHEGIKTHQITLVCGGNGIGKTESEVLEALSWVIGYRPWDKSVTRPPPSRVLLVGPDLSNYCAQAAVPRIYKYMPEEMWARIERTAMGVPHIMYHPNGSTLTLMSYEQHLKKSASQASPFEGIDFHFAGFDEPPPREVFIAIHRGVAKAHGRILLCMTPIAEPWIWDQLYQPAEKNDDICALTISAYDALKSQENPDGIWEKEAFDCFLDSIKGEDHEEARIHGKFKHLVGLVFPEYNPLVHRFDPQKVKIEADWPKGITIDPHDRKPWFITWWAVNPQGQVMFFKEWPTDPFESWTSCQTTWEEYCKFIKAEEENVPGGARSIRWRLIDPNFSKQQKAAVGMTLLDVMAINGLFFDAEIDDSLAHGHAAIRRALSYDKNQPISGTNMPKLLFSQDCYNLDHAIARYLWKRRGRDAYSQKEGVGEDSKDPMDTVRYTLIREPRYATIVDFTPRRVDISRLAHSGLGR